MSRYAHLRRPRWVLMHVLVLLAVGLFAVAGFWQLSRLSERRENNALVRERREMPPVTTLSAVEEHRKARFIGTYDAGEEIVLRGRGSRGRPGDHLLTPLRMGSRAIIVDRGWVPHETPRSRSQPPDRRIIVEGFLLPSEGAGPFAVDGSGEIDSISRIDLDRIASAVDHPIERNAYLLLEEQRPAQDEVPEPVAPATLHEGSHLTYAVQWFSFIPIALIVYAAILRRESKRISSAPD